MKVRFVVAITVIGAVLQGVPGVACSQTVPGNPGASPQWGSGWMDLATSTDFKQGEKLRLRIGGTATKILVRFLSKGTDPNTPSGIDGEPLQIPANRIVEMTLKTDHLNVVQVSVHGGPNPWGYFPLGGGNGPAHLLSIERLPR
jgi:hypothetical protein